MAKYLSRLAQSITSLLVVCACVWGNTSLLEQKPAGAINDFAGLLSQDTKNSLEQMSTALLQKTGVSLVIATAPNIGGEDIDDFANRLYVKWGIGSKENSNGILVLVAVKERAIRIETGFGAEGYLTDIQSKRIIRDIASPYLSKNQWDLGLSNTFFAVGEIAARAHGTSLKELIGQDAPTYGPGPQRIVKPNAFTLILGAVLLLFLLFTKMGRSILFLVIMSSFFSGGRSGNSSSGFGGGFGNSGGFGGGMSGGGGASGRF